MTEGRTSGGCQPAALKAFGNGSCRSRLHFTFPPSAFLPLPTAKVTIGCCAFSRASRISLSSSFFTSNSVCLSQSCAFIPDISTSSSPSPAHVTPRVTLATRQTCTTHLSSILSRKPLFYEPSPCPSVRLASPSHYNRDRRNRPYNYCDQPLHHSATILVAKLLLPHLRPE